MLFLAFGFPPALKSSTYRLRAMGNGFAAAGWDVTVVNAARPLWEDEFGLDESLLEGVDPAIRVVELPLRRADLETDIRAFSEERALHPGRWLRQWREQNLESFPEPTFGGWRDELEAAVLALHDETPFDLVVVSCVPYVLLAPALRLHEERGVPFAVDFRDGWTVDVINGGTAVEDDSPEAAWERRALEAAVSLWVVNDPIAEHYRTRYPELAAKVRVVRNGFDRDSVPDRPPATATTPLTFGYVGTINFKPDFVRAVLDSWRTAREVSPLLRDARWEWRGNLGAGASRGSSTVLELVLDAEDDGVVYGGPVPKNELLDLYRRWDALTFMVIGGAYMTSGKVYEYMATGLPILSVHEVEHDASTLLGGYPLWSGVGDVDPDFLVEAWIRTAELAVGSSDEDRAAARAYADTYERVGTIAAAVQALTEGLEVR
ncbi:glycosyltransferase [Nocardioides lijunqiniae]|uniref:glycosyltransferase n=1 Tax=Nocardioides lijunqiniae TaxID=2760832 RepID=UPI001D0CD665|nr:glycosyltransferase [Nocardioides lijunqiniae]